MPTLDRFLQWHLPHRLNLLTTFRVRYCSRPYSGFATPRPRLNAEQFRDFHRCAKDISMLMVRFFCDELYIFVPEGGAAAQVRGANSKNPSWPKVAGCQCVKLQLNQLHTHATEVLIAANRAVAHVHEVDVDHRFRNLRDNDRLFQVIDWMEATIESNIYQPNHYSLADAMRLPQNVMS